MIEKIDKTKSWSLKKKINKINKTISRLTKIKMEKTQIINMRNDRDDIATDLMDIKEIL